MKTHRRICILTNTHPYGVTENFARHIAIGFAAHGFEPHIVNIMAPLEQQFQAIGALSAIDELFMIGALPLKVKVGDEYLWREMAKRGKRVTYYVIDSYHNDLRRVPEVLEYNLQQHIESFRCFSQRVGDSVLGHVVFQSTADRRKTENRVFLLKTRYSKKLLA